jgi:phosphatidylglycerophosphate synthase
MEWRRNIFTVANAVTAVKIPLAAAFPWSTRSPELELGVILLGALSDGLDGRIARAMGQAGGFGMILDPICDKIFLLTVVGTYVAEARLPVWQLGIVVLRDVWVLLASAILLMSGRWRDVAIGARFFGKAVTVLQFLLFGCITLALPTWPALALLSAASVLACYDYTMAVLRPDREALQ